MNKKWSYRVEFKSWNPIKHPKADYAAWLNRFGDEGYDLVSVVKIDMGLLGKLLCRLKGEPAGTLLQYTFKRELGEKIAEAKISETQISSEVSYHEIPEGYNYLAHQKFFSREFDRLFGDKWLIWKGNSNAASVGLDRDVFDHIRAERTKLKLWYEKMRPNYSKTDEAFDNYWHYLKTLSSYTTKP